MAKDKLMREFKTQHGSPAVGGYQRLTGDMPPSAWGFYSSNGIHIQGVSDYFKNDSSSLTENKFFDANNAGNQTVKCIEQHEHISLEGKSALNK